MERERDKGTTEAAGNSSPKPKPTPKPKPLLRTLLLLPLAESGGGDRGHPSQAGRPSQLTVAEEALLMQHGHGIDDEERGLQQGVERERHCPAGRSGAGPGAAPGAGAGAAPERDVAGLGAEPPLRAGRGRGPLWAGPPLRAGAGLDGARPLRCCRALGGHGGGRGK